MTRKRSLRDKLADDKGFPAVKPLSGGMEKRYGPGTIVIPAPREVAELMRRVPRGSVATINQIRDALARRHDATMACPIVTGIHARIVAGAAAEEESLGEREITPYWRTLKSRGEINAKYPGGLLGQKRRLESEGLATIARGARLFVEDFERFLADLDQGPR